MNHWEWIKLKYRLYQVWRRVAHFFGACPRCGTRCNYTRYGKAICPECGH